MTRKFGEIWNSDDPRSYLPWRAQMTNYVAQFETEEQARRYVKALEEYAEKCKVIRG